MTLEESFGYHLHVMISKTLKDDLDNLNCCISKLTRGLLRAYCREQKMSIYKVNLGEPGPYHAAIPIAGVKEPSQLYSIMKFIGRL